jgi:hypothetical protein
VERSVLQRDQCSGDQDLQGGQPACGERVGDQIVLQEHQPAQFALGEHRQAQHRPDVSAPQVGIPGERAARPRIADDQGLLRPRDVPDHRHGDERRGGLQRRVVNGDGDLVARTLPGGGTEAFRRRSIPALLVAQPRGRLVRERLDVQGALHLRT